MGWGRTSVSVWILLAAVAAQAATGGEDFAGAWLARQTNVQAWRADFRQTRILKTLTQPLVSTGQVWFAAPKNFRWELGGSPPQSLAIRNGEVLQVIYPKLRRAERYDFGAMKDRQWKDALGLLQSGFPRSRQEFEAEFRLLSTAEAEGVRVLELQPRSAAARKLMPRLAIAIGTNDYSLKSTELFFADGSSMRNEFMNGVFDPVVSNQFDLTLPEGFTLVEPAAAKR